MHYVALRIYEINLIMVHYVPVLISITHDYYMYI